MLAARAMSDHFSRSDLISAANSADVLPTGSAPSWASRSRTSGGRSASATAAGSLSIDRLRRAGGREQAVPLQRRIARHAGLGDGRHVRQRRHALRPRHRERAELAGFDQRLGGEQVGEQRRDPAGQHLGHRRAGALERNVLQIDAGHVLEQFHAHVRRRARAGGGVVERAGLGLRERDQLAQRLRRHVRMHHQHVGDAGDLGDRGEILRRVVARLLGDRRQHGDGARRHQQRVAVARRVDHGLDADDAAAAAAVLDEEALSAARKAAGPARAPGCRCRRRARS